MQPPWMSLPVVIRNKDVYDILTYVKKYKVLWQEPANKICEALKIPPITGSRMSTAIHGNETKCSQSCIHK